VGDGIDLADMGRTGAEALAFEAPRTSPAIVDEGERVGMTAAEPRDFARSQRGSGTATSPSWARWLQNG